MILHVDLYGNLPAAWFEYVDENPEIEMISDEPVLIELQGNHPEDMVAGLITAMARLRVPARQVTLGQDRELLSVAQRQLERIG